MSHCSKQHVDPFSHFCTVTVRDARCQIQKIWILHLQCDRVRLHLVVDCYVLVVAGVVGICSQWLLQCRRQSFFGHAFVLTWRLYVPAVTSLWSYHISGAVDGGISVLCRCLYVTFRQIVISLWHWSLAEHTGWIIWAAFRDSYSLHGWCSCIVSLTNLCI